ncbi:MAG TPA: hypothetical protein V6D14_18830 [Coleofasciculaceae cyanobacterium]
MNASAVWVKGMRFASTLSQQVWILLLVLGIFAAVIPKLASAQTPSAQTPSAPEPPLETKLLEPNAALARRNVVTANTISPTQLTTPSFWWIKKQFDDDKEFGNKFIVNWIAYQDEKRVDLVVNRQIWTILDYIGRYRFVNKFGTAARDFNYDVRVFNQQGSLLATYTCNYSTTPPDCEFKRFEAFGRDSLAVPRSQ